MNDIDARQESGPVGDANGSGTTAKADERDNTFREPGWYRDPDEPRWHRYWDGNVWAPRNPAAGHKSAEPGPAAPAEGLPRPRRELD
jgi:hypothetical protein